jgi:hypothetical protein
MEDIHEPLDSYRASLKENHAHNTSDYFDQLLVESGVDEEKNAEIVAEIRDIERLISEAGSSNGWWKFLRIVCWIAAAGFAYMGLTIHLLWLTGTVGLLGVIFAKLNPIIKELNDRLGNLSEQRAQKEASAWKQMEPLNKLYEWNIFANLVQKTVPRIEIDPYFTNGRLTNLRKMFGLKDDFNDPRSVKFAHSGLINGNPFILAQTVNHWIGSKTYRGSLSISWTERVRSSNGQWTSVTRHQTLHASVEKPFPEYANESTLIYGNQAAPDLSFSREPSSLSKLEDGLVSKWRKGRAIKKLEAKSRDLTDDSDFTIMANREFDALFNATDRDHEVQFRLLFTPLAQQEMLNLLKDKDVGYGDQFSFKKSKMINVIEPGHLDGADISADPQKFRSYDTSHARKYFNEYHNELFKGVFFSFAPLLSVPLYQQNKPVASIYAGILQEPSCYWEHESIANYVGETKFQHPDCITRNVLKTSAEQASDGAQVVQVTAHGFRGIDRVDYIKVRGGDGHNHSVAVEWVDYIAVKRSSDLLVCDPAPPEPSGSTPQGPSTFNARFAERGIKMSKVEERRSVAFALLDKKKGKNETQP